MVWFLGFGARGLFVKTQPHSQTIKSNMGSRVAVGAGNCRLDVQVCLQGSLLGSGVGCTVVAGLWTSDSLYGYLGDCNLGDCKLCVGLVAGGPGTDKERALASYGWFEDKL